MSKPPSELSFGLLLVVGSGWGASTCGITKQIFLYDSTGAPATSASPSRETQHRRPPHGKLQHRRPVSIGVPLTGDPAS
eukprot:CAMPEP_0173384748 /NCGR_PEP_ID=MMETSP1356-20130122/7336_1 /TAXON_ID=77927 ORGANISM="Hemiselmis virescens, Strain PCC157" /NCGR_SAMPLE_ID=MMETSP1356 /ASSEMBLY_ACC=CAM_ASM_000847 /LENGTH=78 /DNA_ID=CAMNT_0014340263 /DNA_START=25 /DNA_END=257 /DNA_ORIENTATION=+